MWDIINQNRKRIIHDNSRATKAVETQIQTVRVAGRSGVAVWRRRRPLDATRVQRQPTNDTPPSSIRHCQTFIRIFSISKPFGSRRSSCPAWWRRRDDAFAARSLGDGTNGQQSVKRRRAPATGGAAPAAGERRASRRWRPTRTNASPAEPAVDSYERQACALSQSQPGWVSLSQSEFSLRQTEPDWSKLSQTEPDWARLSQTEPDWARLSQTESDWARLS